MSTAWLPLVVAVYVALDVANPMMPGALTFGVDDSVEARQADRFRDHDDAAPLVLAPAPGRVTPIGRTMAVSRASAPGVTRRSPARVKRAQSSRPAPATPAEDH